MSRLRVFNIQHYSVHDGPGIRTTVFLKGCPLRCQWCCNPESQSFEAQLRYASFHCKNCLRCVQVCPQHAVTVQNGKPSFDLKKCNVCNDRKCLDSCYYHALSLSGQDYETADLMDIILKDKEFYDNSGGGVTFSGGEPLSQAKALLPILQTCRQAGIHTAVETCGFVSENELLQVLPFINLFLVDVKIVDEQSHLFYTKQSNKQILSNLDIISKSGADLIVRVPLIPGATDTEKNIDDLIRVCLDKHIREVNLELYHKLGVSKYGEYGMEYQFQEDDNERDEQFFRQIADKIELAGIRCEFC